MASHNVCRGKLMPQRAASLALVVGLLAACSGPDTPAGSPQNAAKQPLPVAVIEARPTQVPTSIEAVGQTEGAREVEVRARVGGILEKRLYDEGMPVKAGQALFRIDRAPFEIALAQARAQVAEQKAKVEQTSREAGRLNGLLAQRAISQKEFDDATSGAAVARAGLQAAEAKAREAELNLSYTTVTAPVAGISGRAVRSEGTLVSAGADSLLTTVVQMNPIWVRFGLSDSDLAQLPGGRLKPGAVSGVELVLPDGSVHPTKGRLNFAASQIDPKLGTLQLRAEFDNPDARVLPGQFVRARLLTGKRDGVFLVPQTAVMQSDQGRFVFLASASETAEVRPVTAGEWRGKDWVILGGLKAGDKVIVDNLIKVRPGAPVAPHKPGEKPAAAPGAKP